MAKEDAKITENDFEKAIQRMTETAKLEKAQLFHTQDSKRTSWPGGESTDYKKWDDGIGKDGTDYQAKLAGKILKGEQLTPDEISFLSKGQEADKKDDDDAEKAITKSDDVDKADKKDDEKDDDEDKDKVFKSAAQFIDDNEVIQKGIEVSDVLNNLAKAFSGGLENVTATMYSMMKDVKKDIMGDVSKAIDNRFEEQGEFNKSLADVVSNIGHGVHGLIGQANEFAESPARAPKSQLSVIPGGVKVMDKSFGGGQGVDDMISKSQKLEAMCDMVKSGELNPLDVMKFETTNQIHPEVETKIVSKLKAIN